MASAKTVKVKAPKVATKVTKAAKISVGKVVAAKMTEKVLKMQKPSLKAVGLIKAPTVKTSAPAQGTLTRPKFQVGQKASH